MIIDQVGEEEWQDLFPLLTECTAETQCNTTGFYDHLKYHFEICFCWSFHIGHPETGATRM